MGTAVLLGVARRWTSIPSKGDGGGGGEGVEILLVSSFYRNQDKLRPDGPFVFFCLMTLNLSELNFDSGRIENSEFL